MPNLFDDPDLEPPEPLIDMIRWVRSRHADHVFASLVSSLYWIALIFSIPVSIVLLFVQSTGMALTALAVPPIAMILRPMKEWQKFTWAISCIFLILGVARGLRKDEAKNITAQREVADSFKVIADGIKESNGQSQQQFQKTMSRFQTVESALKPVASVDTKLDVLRAGIEGVYAAKTDAQVEEAKRKLTAAYQGMLQDSMTNLPKEMLARATSLLTSRMRSSFQDFDRIATMPISKPLETNPDARKQRDSIVKTAYGKYSQDMLVFAAEGEELRSLMLEMLVMRQGKQQTADDVQALNYFSEATKGNLSHFPATRAAQYLDDLAKRISR